MSALLQANTDFLANTKVNPRALPNDALIDRLERLVQLEKRTTAEILDYIKEVDRRRLYLDLGHTSLFSFLTKGLGYTPASAQRRIDSARLMQAIPEIKNEIESGALNLMQVSMVAQSVRQKQKEDPGVVVGKEQKKELLLEVKNQDIASTQKILANSLNLEVKEAEKRVYQRDESVRVEMTFKQEEMKTLERVKEIISHKHPNLSLSELTMFLAEDFLKRKDPLREKPVNANTRAVSMNGFKMEAAADQVIALHNTRKPIPMAVKRFVFQRDRCCQWVDPKTKQQCKSRFQLQIDHRRSVWAGGGNEPDNLQLLCSVHNALKFERHY